MMNNLIVPQVLMNGIVTMMLSAPLRATVILGAFLLISHGLIQ